MAIDRKDFVSFEGDLTLDSDTSHVIPGSSRSMLDKSYIGGGRGGTVPVSPRVPVPRDSVDPDNHFGDHSDIPSQSDLVNPNYDRNTDPDARDKDRIIDPSDDVIFPGTTITPFVPDSNLSSSENLVNLQAWIDSLFSASSVVGNIYDGATYANILTAVYQSVWRITSAAGLDSDARLTLSEKISDLSWNLITMQFQQALSYQTWYLQQEYNTPLNQINRLASAGLSSAFALGNLNSGNSSSPAGVASSSPVQPSGASEVNQQHRQSDLGFIGSIVSAASSFLPGAAGAVASLVTSFATKKMTAKEIQLADSNIINNAATFEKIVAETKQIDASPALQLFDYAFKQSESSIHNQKSAVDSAQSRYDLALKEADLHKQKTTVQGYRVIVHDNAGNKKSYDMTVDETKDFIKNHGSTTDGFTAVGVESWEKALSASGSVGTSVDIPLVGSASVSGSLSASDKTSGSNSKTSSRTKESGHEVGSDRGSSSTGYNENGTSFHIGETEFTSIQLERNMTIPEYKKYLDSCRSQLDSAIREYNTLKTGERARILDLLNHTTEGLSDFSSRLIHNIYMHRIDSLFSPKTFVGD